MYTVWCNTLQPTATPYNAPQHAATQVQSKLLDPERSEQHRDYLAANSAGKKPGQSQNWFERLDEKIFL